MLSEFLKRLRNKSRDYFTYTDLSGKLNKEIKRNKSLVQEIDQLNKSHHELQKKYRNLYEGGFTNIQVGTKDTKLVEVDEILQKGLDSIEIKAKIDAYHKTLSRKGYNHTWKKRLELIYTVIERGETSLSRALACVRRTEERRRNMGLESNQWVVNDTLMMLPWQPAAAAYRSAVIEAILEHVRPNTRKIIETGSGWGEHLCNIFLDDGPFDATYYALELEEEGRKCALVLSKLEPMLKLEAHFFDYLHPDYSAIQKDEEHTILFTAHSIEQVAEIHPNCIIDVLSLSKEVTGIHFEPVGWQTYPKESWTKITADHYERCKEMAYNTNIWSLLNKFQDDGLIKIITIKPNFIGLDHNPATLIVWEKV